MSTHLLYSLTQLNCPRFPPGQWGNDNTPSTFYSFGVKLIWYNKQQILTGSTEVNKADIAYILANLGCMLTDSIKNQKSLK